MDADLTRKKIDDSESESELDQNSYNKRAADDESEEEESDEEEEIKQRKKRRRKLNPFIEEEAEVDDDEEEEGYDDFDEPAEDEAEEFDEELQKSYLDDSKHRQLDRRQVQDEDVNAEELAEILKQRYGRTEYGAYQGDLEHVPQRLLIPSVNDPKLWLVRCKPGKERDIVYNLMRKFLDYQTRDRPIEIYSAFARESLQGYIYIEAEKQAHVQYAIDKMMNVYGSKLHLVPVNEMVDCLNIKKKDLNLNPGTWVRIKRGKYENDLAQIVERYDTDDIVKLKIVPRIDYSILTSADKKKKKSIRPFAKLFSVDSVQDKKSLSNLRGGYYQYQGDLFDRNGYLEKDVRVANLILDNINPSLEELTRFSGGAITENSMELAQLAQPTSYVAENFEVGEKVEVIEGDLMNLPGTVQSLERDIITIKASGEFGLDRTLQFSASQLRKRFSEGDHVKVVNGIHKNETGMILNIANNVITLLTDGSMKSIQVFSKDLRSAADVTTIEVSNTPGSQYEINDLVHLSPTEVAVVLKIDREFIHVMNQHGSLLKVKPQQISSKRDSKRAVTTDSQGISMTAGDTVQVYDPRKADLNRRATILHVFRGFVFVQSRDVSENNGVFVTKASNLTVMGTSTNGPPKPGFQNRGPPPMSRGGFQGGVGRGRDPLLAKTVTITSGPYKGYIGIVKDIYNEWARVELHTNSKLIKVERNSLQLPGDVSVRRTNNYYGSRFDGGRTPMFGGSKTPMHRGDGGMTPNAYAEGGRTPAWNAGSRTPAWETGSRTPAWETGSRTPAWEAGSRTPGHNAGGRTPAWEAGSRTPGYNPGGRTPAWEAGSRTPAQSREPDISKFTGVRTSDEKWVHEGIEVKVKTRDNRQGYIQHVDAASLCEVKLFDSGEVVMALPEQLNIVRPEKKQKVRVLSGDYAGQYGTLVGLEGSDGVIKLQNGGSEVINMNQLAKSM